MRCQEVVERMHRYIDHDLNDKEKEELLAHIKTCESCSEKFQILQKLSHDLEKLPDVSPPFSLVDRIMPQLDEIDRGRKEQGSTIQEMKKEDNMIPLSVHTGNASRSFRKTRLGRILMGTAAAAVVLGVAVYQHQPQELNQAEIDKNYSLNELGPSTVTGSGGGVQEEENMISPQPVDEKPGLEQPNAEMTPEANSQANPNVDAAQPAPASEPVNQDGSRSITSDPDKSKSVSPEPAAPIEAPSSDKGTVPNSSLDKNNDKSAPSPNNSVSPGTSNKKDESPKTDSKGNNPKQDPASQKTPTETDKVLVPDTSVTSTESEEPLSSDDTSSISMLSLDENFPSLATSVSPKWLSPDGLYLVGYKDSKLSVYRLDGTKKDQRTLLQEIEIQSTFVKGSWSDDSLTYHYEVELDGKTTKHSYAVTKEDQKTDEKIEDKSTTNPSSQTETQSTDNKR
ncbi:zf-HC2 domain-containing protein [Paenibacillus gallinarum]|uniref:Zf-HC2 domain-containing protein n=1 Tax=Paenibacillus gallinarum TaxID=2762232 RepID=A0ABR8SVS5_9BACL|nr:zf-HC2 domain-containing protein [Paenibacillus gallinarum]MBD7967557.1 zf-HC2 domain-containing protein [Paenibacillus gallinarum]